MMPRTLGFDWKVQLPWLDETAAHVARGVGPKELRGQLNEYLQRQTDVSLSPTARSKAITVLSHLWCDVPDQTHGFRDRSLELLHDVLPEERVVVHWSMAIATYPFFTDVVVATGTLLSLQGVAEVPSVRRRVSEEWGDRSTVGRATGVVIGTVRDWGLLIAVGKGRAEAAAAKEIGPELSGWLIEALLESGRVGSLSVNDAVRHPAFFPFRLSLDATHLRSAASLTVERYADGVDVVRLSRLR
jgi:hypothetical protein